MPDLRRDLKDKTSDLKEKLAPSGGSRVTGASTFSEIKNKGLSGFVKHEANVNKTWQALKPSTFVSRAAGRHGDAGVGYHVGARFVSGIGNCTAVHGLNTSPDPLHQIRDDYSHMMGHGDASSPAPAG